MFAILRQMLTKFQHQIAGKIAAKEKYVFYELYFTCIFDGKNSQEQGGIEEQNDSTLGLGLVLGLGLDTAMI